MKCSIWNMWKSRYPQLCQAPPSVHAHNTRNMPRNPYMYRYISLIKVNNLIDYNKIGRQEKNETTNEWHKQEVKGSWSRLYKWILFCNRNIPIPTYALVHLKLTHLHTYTPATHMWSDKLTHMFHFRLSHLCTVS